MTAAVVWLIVGFALIVAEVISGEFVLLMLGTAALVTGGVSALTGNPYLDAAVFAASAVGLLFLVRPALKRKFLGGEGAKTNTEALVGTHAVVLSTVDGHGGTVKLAGDTWSARAYVEHDRLQPGTKVTVMEISGATAVVSPDP
ncbi:NfeD family protein [Amycolatopsis sp. cg5]|uniref:NfeD family protein n=1 Tax=Amycolatopsis sp. cg5 TaxID=3238802 RepID=UPI003524CCFE